MEPREVTYLAVILRIFAAVIVGGILGLERGMKHRPAGLRTYMLVCVGACVIMLTNQYAFQMFDTGDPVRMGAQVVSGIGFLGAGTIIVTRRSQIKGLTTAAGLWTAAIVGLALGAGFFEGGLLATVLILLAESLFSRLEHWILNRSPVVHLRVEYVEKKCLDEALRLFRENNVRVLNMQITRQDDRSGAWVILELRLTRKYAASALLQDLLNIPGVEWVEEL